MMRSSLISPAIRLANERKDPSWARTTMAITAVRNWCSSSNEVVNDELQCRYCQSPVGCVRYRLVTAHVVL